MEFNRKIRFARRARGLIHLVLTFVFLISLILAGCAPGSTPEPTQDVQALIEQALQQTQAVQTQIAGFVAGTLAAGKPISQANPSDTPTSTPAEINYPLPQILEQILVNPQIHSVETFDNWTGEGWNSSDNVGVVSDEGNSLRLPGQPVFATWLVSPAIRPGQGILTRVKLSGASFGVEFFLPQNQWDSPSYKRFGGGLYQTDRMETSIYAGSDKLLAGKELDGSLRFGPDRWYGLFIGVDHSGGFRLLVWDWEDPGQSVWQEYQGNNDWLSGEWVFNAQVDTGRVFLDDFSIVSFDGFGPFLNNGTVKTPTRTPTTRTGAPVVSVSMDTNCRTGPGASYPSVGSLMTGETAEVVGRSPNGDFWIIKNLDNIGTTCWLWGLHATVTGDTSNLPVIQPPPLPSPTPTPKQVVPNTNPGGANANPPDTNPGGANANPANPPGQTITGTIMVNPNPVPNGANYTITLAGFPAGITVEIHFSKRVGDHWAQLYAPQTVQIGADGGYNVTYANAEAEMWQVLAEVYYSGSVVASNVYIMSGP